MRNLSTLFLTAAVLCSIQGCGTLHQKEQVPVVEMTVAQAHQAMKQGTLTALDLVDAYISRIRNFDKKTGLNAIIMINPDAREQAIELDEEFARTGKLRPLHGIPIIVKDNYDTKGLQTTGGSLAMKGSTPPDDAFQVRRLREAGAIVLAKSNMAEWAFSPYQTVSSIAGITANPYDLTRVPAGSSGGTAAAVAANLGMAGMGTDTGNSIRGPSSHCCLAGIRSTMGLTSRDGIIPLYLRNDIGGPMARTVEDAVRILDCIAGYDPADPVTSLCRGKKPRSYLPFLKKDGLEGKRIGVFRFYTDNPATDPDVLRLFEQAVDDMRQSGAVMIDPFTVPRFKELTAHIWINTFHRDVNSYLRTLGDDAPVKTLRDIVESGKYAPYIEERLIQALAVPDTVVHGDIFHEPANIALRTAFNRAMDRLNLDAIIYPTWSNPPRKIGDMESPAGDNSQLIPPHTGFPGLTVPMGFTPSGLPAGLQIVGRLFSEPMLIETAYGYEQATGHREPPQPEVYGRAQ